MITTGVLALIALTIVSVLVTPGDAINSGATMGIVIISSDEVLLLEDEELLPWIFFAGEVMFFGMVFFGADVCCAVVRTPLTKTKNVHRRLIRDMILPFCLC